MITRTMSVRRTKHGFTLIELLVVIAIIALLAAILFPVFARARENARKSSCANNLKQIGAALMQYAQDYDEIMVSGAMTADAGTFNANGRLSHIDLLQPYVKSYQSFRCPSNSRANTTLQDGLRGGSATAPILSPISYMAPTDDSNAISAIGRRHNVGPNLADFTSTAQTISMLEGNANNTDFRITGTHWDNLPANDSGTGNPSLFFGHMGTANFLFADGHVKNLKPYQTVPPAMGGTGAMNMWHRNGTNYTGGELTSTRNKLDNAIKKYD